MPSVQSWSPQKLSIRRMMRITMRHLRYHRSVAQTHSCAVSCAVAVAALWCLKFFSKTVWSPLLLLSRLGRGVCILEKSKNQVSTRLVPALTPSWCVGYFVRVKQTRGLPNPPLCCAEDHRCVVVYLTTLRRSRCDGHSRVPEQCLFDCTGVRSKEDGQWIRRTIWDDIQSILAVEMIDQSDEYNE